MSEVIMFRRGSGGGVELDVKQYPSLDALPATAVENSLAIITEHPISGWAISPTEPEGREGLIWIDCGYGGSLPLELLRKNSLLVYPRVCKQYVSGSWLTVPARIYAASKWQSFVVGLFQNGAVTALGAGFGEGFTFYSGSTLYGKGSLSITDGCLLYAAAVSKNATGIGSATNAKIDLTDYSRATAHIRQITKSGVYPGAFYLMACSTRSGNGQYGSCVAVSQIDLSSIVGETDLVLDLSEVSGEYYIALGLRHSGNTSAQGGSVYVDALYLN